MNLCIQQIPGFSTWSGPATKVLRRCDGAAPHRPHPPTAAGLARTAGEMAGLSFPRSEVGAILLAANEAVQAPAAALENCRRLAEPGALAVVAGQQPMPAGGPLMVFYKALGAVALARRAREQLGLPVVPLFWNASEDHDLDEMGRAGAPGRGKGVEPDLFRAHLDPWRGRPAAGIGPDPRWQEPLAAWLGEISPREGDPTEFAPRPGVGWADHFSRVLSRILGPEGLVVVEPRHLRPLAGEIYGRVIEEWPRVEELLARSRSETGRRGEERSFPPLEGPPLFLEGDTRRRIVAVGEGLELRGGGALPAAGELAARARTEPQSFSAHAVLRPILQNRLLPVAAAILGPGELAYHEELYLFHRDDLGAGRRMPILVPRPSATVIDHRIEAVMERFGIAPRELFLGPEELVERFTPTSGLAGEIAAVGRRLREELDRFRERAVRLEPTLAKPFQKGGENAARTLEKLAGKVGEAEARARGFAPDQLRRLAAWVRPGGRPQERVFSLAAFPALGRRDTLAGLLAEIDPFSFDHCLIRPERSGSGGS